MNKFKELENNASGFKVPLQDLFEHINFNDQGLIPAIAQQYDTKEVLMMAWMNLDSIKETLATGHVCYWSRSRGTLWRKGESSGQVQKLVTMAFDCDGDTLLLKVDQMGPACHTGRRNCFFYEVAGNELYINSDVQISPQDLYKSD